MVRWRVSTLVVVTVLVAAACGAGDEGDNEAASQGELASATTALPETDADADLDTDRNDDTDSGSATDDDPADDDVAEPVDGPSDDEEPTEDSATTPAVSGGDGAVTDYISDVGYGIGDNGRAPFGPGSATTPDGTVLVAVERGADGDEVIAIQERLAELGFAPGKPDGDYGGRTVDAIEAFQWLVGLEPSGDANLSTVSALAGYRYDGLVLRAGEEGDEVEGLQEMLATGPFDPGSPDGEYGGATVRSVWALEKLAGLPVDGDWGPLDQKAWEMLQAGEIGVPVKDHDQRWVEVDLSEQLMKIYDPGSETPTLISHISSGSGVPWENDEYSGSSVTPLGSYHINRRISGWRESSLNIGRLYNPLYFNGGIAFHGATSVPLGPASHGCIRVPMHIADYLPAELPNGTPVHILA